jgi:uncharacterized cofD-like protein
VNVPRVVTLGGGHGQAALLSALSRLVCDVTAIVSVADDGGCSGRLRDQIGMPPPGDVRRCLSSLAVDATLAERFEERVQGGKLDRRSRGNLILAELWLELGSVTLAAARAGEWLGASARVLPVAEAPGTLRVYDRFHGALAGESHIERTSGSAVVATVEGPEHATPAVVAALLEADFVFFGPGSFVGSTLAVLTTGDVAASVVRSPARRVLVKNVASEERTDVPGAVPTDQHERMLRDHLVIGSLGDPVTFDTLSHFDGELLRRARVDGSVELLARIADDHGRTHDVERLAHAIGLGLGIGFRPESARATPRSDPQALEDTWQRARARFEALK